MQNKTFRLFVSSTFSDFNEERKLLQTIVFPEIKKYCRDNGLNFQPIDLRWGVTEEASNDQKTLSLCLEEVQSSKYHPYPNFLIMAGDRYGWVPLPYAIEQNEYETILQNIDILSDKELLNTWYKLDENQIPVSYILKKREKENDGIDYTNKDTWRKIESQLKTILQSGVKKSQLREEQKRKYFTSATEAEVIEGIFKYLHKTKFQNKLLEKNNKLEKIDYENVFGYIRNIESFDEKTLKNKFVDDDLSKVKIFKEEIRKSINKSNILEVNVNLKNISKDNKNGSLNYFYEAISNDRKSKFVKEMFEYLKSSIDKFRGTLKNISIDELQRYEQERFKNDKLKDFLDGSRIEVLESIDDYVNNDNNQALVIYGKSGLGKSSLMAKAINDSILKYPNKKIVYRFVGSTANLSSSVELLISILKELGINEEVRKAIDIKSYQIEYERIEYFYYRIFTHLITLKKEIVIFIDAVDQLTSEDEFFWLPKKLPKNLKIIISALSDENYEKDSKYFENLKFKTANLYTLETFENSKELINYLLSHYERTISDYQLEYLGNIYKKINTPLYLSVAAQEIKHWNSNDKTQSLASTQKGIIEEYILNLSKLYHHDKELITRVFSYIYLSNGVSESELLELLSIDEEFINYLAPETFHSNVTKELPIVIWVRLYTQIKEFFKLENKNNHETMNFFHREFKEVISQTKNIRKVHEELVTLLQKLIIKYQYELIDTNRWSELYLEIIKNYHLEYEFDYSLDNNSKLKFWAEFFTKMQNTYYLECILNRLREEDEINKIEISNIYLKLNYYILSILYKTNPSRWAEDYTSSLNNLAYSLKLIEKTNEAMEFEEEALEIRKKLYKENPERWEEDYTSSLINLAISLKSIGQTNEAIELETEALEISKELYKTNSLRRAELFTKSLNNLAISLKSIEKTNEAIELETEALEITKKLYKENPERWAEDYTSSLINLAISLKSIEKTNEAIELETEALEITKKLYKENPERWAEDYTISLNNLASSLKSIEKTNEAIELETEALEITKKLYKENPERWAEDYTTSLNNLAISLKLIEKTNEAIELYQEALEINKKLYKENPSRWAKYYTVNLNNLADSLQDIEKIDEAIELQKEALEINKELYKVNPLKWSENYTTSLNNLAISLKEIEKIDEAIELSQEALEIRKELYKENPLKWAEAYILSLNNLAYFLKTNEAIELYQEALEINKKLYKENPSRWAKYYTVNLNNLADSLQDIEKIDEAIELQKEALEINKELYKVNPLKWSENYTTSLNNLAISLKEIEKIDEAIELSQEALEIRKELYKENPLKWAEAYILSLNNLLNFRT